MSHYCAIWFTQYVRPHGIPQPVTIDRPDVIAQRAVALVSAGCRFEIEVLRTGEVSMTCERDTDDGEVTVLAQEIVPNGPEVPVAVDRLVDEAAKAVIS